MIFGLERPAHQIIALEEGPEFLDGADVAFLHLVPELHCDRGVEAIALEIPELELMGIILAKSLQVDRERAADALVRPAQRQQHQDLVAVFARGDMRRPTTAPMIGRNRVAEQIQIVFHLGKIPWRKKNGGVLGGAVRAERRSVANPAMA